jgi:hypothetical protein
LWPQNKIFEAVLAGSPLLGALPKDKSFGEEYRYINEGTYAGQGISAAFDKAKNAKSPDGAAQFQYSTKTLYSLFSMPGKLMRRAEINAAVLVDPYTRASKNAIRGLKRELSAHMYGNGGGAVGRISSTSNVATNTITLADTSRHRFFYKDMVLNTASTDGTTGTVNPGTVKIVDVIREGANKGNIVLDQVLTAGIPSAAANDYLFRDGCFGAVINGFGAHIPSTTPSGSFLGVNRSTLTAETAGLRVTATDLLVKDAVYQAAMDVVDMWGDPDLCVLNTRDWNVLRKELDNQTIISVQAKGYGGKVVTGVSYGGLEIMGPNQKIEVLCDPDCPPGRGYMLTREAWKLASMGELVRLISKDPMMEENADSWESRFVTESELQCESHAPNATFQLTAGA